MAELSKLLMQSHLVSVGIKTETDSQARWIHALKPLGSMVLKITLYQLNVSLIIVCYSNWCKLYH